MTVGIGKWKSAYAACDHCSRHRCRISARVASADYPYSWFFPDQDENKAVEKKTRAIREGDEVRKTSSSNSCSYLAPAPSRHAFVSYRHPWHIAYLILVRCCREQVFHSTRPLHYQPPFNRTRVRASAPVLWPCLVAIGWLPAVHA